jgi:hypothetical protein
MLTATAAYHQNFHGFYGFAPLNEASIDDSRGSGRCQCRPSESFDEKWRMNATGPLPQSYVED